MSITKGVPAPISYRKLHESKTVFNLNDRLVLVWFIQIILCWLSLISISQTGFGHIVIYLSVILVFVAVLLFTSRDVQTLDKNIFMAKLFFRILRKKDRVIKYVEPLDDLKEFFDLQSVEESGTIRYEDDTSGVLISYIPPRPAEHDLDTHSNKIKQLLGVMYEGYSFHFFANSVTNYANPLLETTKTELKKPNQPKEVMTHLMSLYEEAINQKRHVNDEFVLLVVLPKTDTINEAEQKRNAFIPSVLTAMTRANIHTRAIEDRTEVIKLLRRQLCHL